MSSVHGSYRHVVETEQALIWIGRYLAQPQFPIIWYLDKPVSNSGTLASNIRNLAGENHWPWQVEVVFNPDMVLKKSGFPVISSDSSILDDTTT